MKMDLSIEGVKNVEVQDSTEFEGVEYDKEYTYFLTVFISLALSHLREGEC